MSALVSRDRVLDHVIDIIKTRDQIQGHIWSAPRSDDRIVMLSGFKVDEKISDMMVKGHDETSTVSRQ